MGCAETTNLHFEFKELKKTTLMKGTDGKPCGEMLLWMLSVVVSDLDEATNINLLASCSFKYLTKALLGWLTAC